MSIGVPLVSADGHVIEPPDLFTERIAPEFRDRAPHVEVDDNGWVTYVIGEGLAPLLPGVTGATGRLGLSMDEARRMGYEALRPSGWDPDERVKDQDVDGVAAEVIYPTLGRRLFGLHDARLRRACFRAYNDWLAEFCGAHPDRLVGVALVDLEEIDEGVAEIERAASLGHRAAAIWEAPPEDRPYRGAEYEPLWRALVAHDMSAALHVGSGASAAARTMHAQSSAAAAKLAATVDVSARLVPIQQTIQDLTVGGVLERHPDLEVVSVENNVGWVPYFLQALDAAYEKLMRSADTVLPLKPSDYVRRQMFFTFEEDPVGAATCHHFGEDNYMWASDFPHPASTWPHSHKVVERDFAAVPDPVTAKVVSSNAAALYRIDLRARPATAR